MTQTFKISQVCLANATRDDMTENYRFGRRLGRINDMLSDMFTRQIDIVSIKEIRKCKDVSGQGMMEPSEIWNLFTHSSGYSSANFSPVKLTRTQGIENWRPFYMGQLYNPNKLTLVNTFCFRLYMEVFGSDTVTPHMGGCIISCLYAPNDPFNVPDISRLFFVDSFHLPINETHKLLMCKYICNNYQELKTRIFGETVVPTIRIGDFNTFCDKPDSIEQLHYLKQDWTVENTDMTLVDKNFQKLDGSSINYTFLPFPHDIIPGVENSFLDYVFLEKDSQLETISTVLVQDNLPVAISDHLPLIYSFKFS